MVNAGIASGSLEGEDIPWLFHHADQVPLASLVAADTAQFLLGVISATDAGMDAPLRLGPGTHQIPEGGFILGQKMICQALGGFTSDGGQTGQLADQVLDDA